MALAIPGGAPGYDEDKQFGNNITHMVLRLPEGCANHSARPRKVKAKARREGFYQHNEVRRDGRVFFATAVIPWGRSEAIQAVIPGRALARTRNDGQLPAETGHGPLTVIGYM